MEETASKIVVKHLNVRQSIAILLFKLVAVEIFAGFCVLLLHFIIFNAEIVEETLKSWNAYTLFLLVVFVALKTFFTIFLVMRWLEEYYEVTDHSIIHRKGFIFKKEDEVSYKHIRAVRLEQGLLGRMFNYGTVVLYDWDMKRDIPLYQIHNPYRYKQLFIELIPNVDVDKKVLREHIIEPDDE